MDVTVWIAIAVLVLAVSVILAMVAGQRRAGRSRVEEGARRRPQESRRDR